MHFTSFKWDLELLGGASKRTQGSQKNQNLRVCQDLKEDLKMFYKKGPANLKGGLESLRTT